MPHVSIVVPNYNHARFLERRIQSVLEQTYQDFELILLDDASTDDSLRIIEQYRHNSRVTIVINETNSGSPFPQWNRGVQLACGDYVWIAEADDDAEPELLETLVTQLDSNPSAVLAYCQSWIIDEWGNRLETKLSYTEELDKTRWMHNFLNDGRDEVRRFLVVKNTIPNASAVLFRRADYLQTAGAPTHMRLCGDWMVWIGLALRGDIAFVARPLNLFREHGGTVRASSPDLRLLHEAADVVATIEARVGVPDAVARPLSRALVNQWLSEYWRNLHPIALGRIGRVGALAWRMNPPAGTKFFLFFLLRKAIGAAGLKQVRELWRFCKRLRATTPV